MKIAVGSLSILFVAILSISTPAADHVAIDMISNVNPGQTNVRIGIYISNDLPALLVVLPFEIRTLAGNAYIAPGVFERGRNPAGRVYNSPLGPADPNGMWPAAWIVERTFADPDPTLPFACPSRADSAAFWNTSSALPDFQSPDAVMMVSFSVGNPNIGELISLTPGSDPPGVPSYEIVCNVGPDTGVIVIDSTCVSPANVLHYIADGVFPVYPTFQRGLIGVGMAIPGDEGCACPCFGNYSLCVTMGSGVLRVVTIVDVAFRGVTAPKNPSCPVVDTDVNCSGKTDVVDVVKAITVEFRGGDAAEEYCTPCLHGESLQQ